MTQQRNAPGPPGGGPGLRGVTVLYGVGALVITALATIASLVAELLDGPGKQALIGSAIAGVLAGTWATIRTLDGVDPVRDLLHRVPRWGWYLIVGVPVTLVVAAGFVVVRPYVVPDRCPAAVEVTVLTPDDTHAELAGLVQDFADRYVDAEGCPIAHVTAFAADPPTVRTAMASGWSTDALRDVGPRPDVWIAESVAQVDAVADDAVLRAAGGETAPAGDTTAPGTPTPGPPPGAGPATPDLLRRVEVGSTPLVLAVAGEIPTAERSGVPTPDLLEAAAAAGFPVVRAAPDTSFTALRHAEAAYRGADAATLRRTEQRIALGLAATGLPTVSDAVLLCRLLEENQGSDVAPAAVLTTERAMVMYNLGRSCPSGADPGDGLVAYYPQGAGAVAYVATQVGWPTGTGAHAGALREVRSRAAGDLLDWLAADAQQTLPDRLGLRRADGSVRAPLDAAHGVLDQVVPESAAPSWQTLQGTLTTYRDHRLPSHVLVVVDASGSMREEVGATGATRFATASLRVRESLRLLGPGDGFGLSFFSGPAATSPQVELPLGRGWTDADVAGALARHAPDGAGPVLDTPLYDAIADGLTELDARAAAEPDALYAMVVLTDGRDESDTSLTAAQVAARADAAAARVYVVAVGEATCEETGLDGVAAATGGLCANSGFDDLDDTLTTFFLQLWGGHGR